MPADSIIDAACNFFRCFIGEDLFDSRLDFVVREWARRDPAVRSLIDEADANRLAAVTKMYQRFGYADAAADARARVLYFMQLGYHALDVQETIELRMGRLPQFLECFTGETATPKTVEDFAKFAFGQVGKT